MNDNLKISLIIPTLDRPESLKNTLISISQKTFSEIDEILIIDQGNLNIIDFYSEFKDLKLTIYKVNFKSLTKARNFGLEKAKNEIIVFCDDDVIFVNNSLGYLFEKFSNDYNLSLVAGRDFNLIDKKVSLFGYFSFRKNFFKRKIGHITNLFFGYIPNSINGIIKTEWAMGYFFAIRKSIQKNGQLFFDEKLKSYAFGEDLDFTKRYINYSSRQSKKYTHSIFQEIGVQHMISKEYRIPGEKFYSYYLSNRIYFSYKFKKTFLNRFLIFLFYFIDTLFLFPNKKLALKIFLDVAMNLREIKNSV